jgi:hypothetical protein
MLELDGMTPRLTNRPELPMHAQKACFVLSRNNPVPRKETMGVNWNQNRCSEVRLSKQDSKRFILVGPNGRYPFSSKEGEAHKGF